MTAWVGGGESTRSPVEKDLQFWKVLEGQWPSKNLDTHAHLGYPRGRRIEDA